MSINDLTRLRVDRVGPPPLPKLQKSVEQTKPGQASFSDHLKQACKEVNCEVTFSGHAETRAFTRDINLNSDQLDRLGKAVDSASDKGSKKALVLIDDLALLVGVQKKTVITMVDKDSMQDNVFTEIDSAVVA